MCVGNLLLGRPVAREVPLTDLYLQDHGASGMVSVPFSAFVAH